MEKREKISFNRIKKMFPEEEWDIGYLNEDQLLRAAYAPVKIQIHQKNAVNFSNNIHFIGMTNTLVFARKGDTWDYSHYDEIVSILNKNGVERWFQIYTNYKVAAVLSGIGVRARNSLIYNYKFGFDCHYGAVGFIDEIVDVPDYFRENHGLWSRCRGCDDCVKACPVGAIHYDEDTNQPPWVNSGKCDDFIGLSDHPTIPSIKTFWKEHVYPDFPKEEADALQNWFQVERRFNSNGLPWDRNGFSFDGNVTRKNGRIINIPICRECTSQPRCSKWGGNYPYESEIKFYRNKAKE